jgi:surface protein
MEWFAVVTDNSIGYINSYAKNIQAGIDYFKPPGQANPVIFNNIVTTLVTNMSEMFYNATSFNEDISSWDTSILTYMSFMFYNASAFNQNLSGWNVGNVIERGYFATGSPLALPENSHKLPPFVV